MLAAAACGGSVGVDPIGSPPSGEPKSNKPNEATKPEVSPTKPTVIPPQPTGPYGGLVATTDVSILYPMPLSGASTDFVRPTEIGNHGALLPASVVETVLQGRRRLERTSTEFPSGYDAFRLVSVRLDPCSSRGNAGCKSEVRLVFQSIYDKPAGRFGDPVAGPAAADGAVHVMYDVPEADLVTMMKQILTIKKANGGLALEQLAPHPILALQGLGGTFAGSLRNILLEHLGDARIMRVTFFDHNMEPDSDGWRFGLFDKTGGAFVETKIPVVQIPMQIVAGSSALAELGESGTTEYITGKTIDDVSPLVDANRPSPAAPGAAALTTAYEAALKVQNPTKHSAESMDCANCHLAEGAALLGRTVYAFTSTTNAFTHARSRAYVSERTSVTNLHAFGYLHRKVAIMERTANESVIVADAMEKKVK